MRIRVTDEVTRLSPNGLKQSIVDNLELDFVSTIVKTASEVLGKRAVPLVPSGLGKRIEPSADYVSIRMELEATQPQQPEADELRARLNNLDRDAQKRSYLEWKDEFSKLPVTQRIKVMNRCLRRRSAAGSCLATTTIALESYRDHFASQFTNPFEIEPFYESIVPLDQATEVGLAAQTFSLAIVKQAVMRSPTGKAPGITGLSAELLHPVVDRIAPVLSRLFCVYMTLSTVPSSWKRALMCPVPKKGDLSRITNYRPISLTELTRKIFEMCMLQRLGPEVKLSREQGGFRGHRSTLDQVECLDELIKQVRGHDLRRKVFMAFLDIKAAYDSVPRAELWRQCQNLGVDHLTLSSLRALFDHNSAQLVIAQKRSRPFSLPAGVLQGSVLSPLLYSIYLDPLVEKLRDMGPRICLPHSPDTTGINALMYADDIAIIAKSSRDMTRLLKLAEEDSLVRGYRFSPAKCVTVGQNGTRQRLYGLNLTRANSFCYLGIDVNCQGICEKSHAKRRGEKAEKSASALEKVGARFSNFPSHINLQFYRIFIRPGLEYGLPLLKSTEAIDILQKCQKRILCGFLGVHSNARNDIIEGISNCPSMLVRNHLLGRKRAIKQRSIWSGPDRTDYALMYVLEGMHGPAHAIGESFNFSKSQEETRMDLYVIPTLRSLADRSGGFLSIAVLRWLLHLPLSHGIFRVLLLWILRRWRKFQGTHLCLHCHSSFTDQAHIASCAGMRARLVEYDCVDFSQLTYSNDNLVEHALLLISQEFIMNPKDAAKALQLINDTVISCLGMILSREY